MGVHEWVCMGEYIRMYAHMKHFAAIAPTLR